MPAPRRDLSRHREARAEARIEAHALFARRPALSRCGGLSPVSRACGVVVGPWATGRHPTAPRHCVTNAPPATTPPAPHRDYATVPLPRVPASAADLGRTQRCGGCGGDRRQLGGRVSEQSHHSGDPLGPSLRNDSTCGIASSASGYVGSEFAGHPPSPSPIASNTLDPSVCM
jgi:hypothetical protein